MSKIKSKKNIIRSWQRKNPRGSKSQCMKDTGLSKMTVYKWWDDDLHESVAGFKKQTGREDKALLIAEWKALNPGINNKTRCARELGISKTTVIKWWDVSVEDTKKEDTITVKVEKNWDELNWDEL